MNTSLICPPNHAQTMLLMADRVQRTQNSMRDWAETAKECVNFFEGRQWSADDIAKLALEKRPSFTFNKIGALVRLVLGYYTNNRTDLKFMPSHDGSGRQAVAEALSKIGKQIANSNGKQYVDSTVFLDGMLTGRGFYDVRLDFSKNILGEQRVRDKDPFAIGLDPDGNTYDLNDSCNFVYEGRWVSIDEVIYTYGEQAGALLAPYFGSRYRGGTPAGVVEQYEEITPWRGFGGTGGDNGTPFMQDYLAQMYDPARKSIRLVDMQHKIPMKIRYLVDLETGSKEPVPEGFDEARVGKMMAWLSEQYWMKGKVNPWRMATLPGHKIRWTTMVGDIIVYDKWSQYETYTLVPFFPYFRRGQTRGMVADLIDPQKEVNKRRNSEIEIVTRTAHAGWMYHKDGLTDEGREQIENHGAMPGVNIEWKGDPAMKPEPIKPGVPPTAMSNLEQKATAELKEIAGINDSALGQLDRVQSGRAIEARQRQSVLAIQSFMDNMGRTQMLYGRKTVEIVQNHYTQRRVFQIINDNGQDIRMVINDEMASGEIVNDVALGHYEVSIDETPLSSAFLAGQFEEMITMVEKGILPVQAIQDIIVDASSIPRKDIVKQRVQAIMAAQGIPTGDAVLNQPPGMVPGMLPGAPPSGPPMGATPAQPGPAMAANKEMTEGISA